MSPTREDTNYPLRLLTYGAFPIQTLLAIMTGAFGLAGWHFSSNPTSSSSENKVAIAPGSEPWNTGGSGKYQYHPGGDVSKGKKDAPSALNEVIIPNVNLPKVSNSRP